MRLTTTSCDMCGRESDDMYGEGWYQLGYWDHEKHQGAAADLCCAGCVQMFVAAREAVA